MKKKNWPKPEAQGQAQGMGMTGMKRALALGLPVFWRKLGPKSV